MLPTAKVPLRARWERYLSKGKAPSSEVPSVFYRFSLQKKGADNVIFTEKLSNITGRVPKWCLDAARGSKNMTVD